MCFRVKTPIVKSRRLFLRILSGVLLTMNFLFAEEEAEEKNELKNKEIPVIRVSANQSRMTDRGDILTVPADIIRISREQIKQSHAASVPELLTTQANIQFRSSTGKANTGELAMRGFGENSGLRVLVLVDGQVMNRADMGTLDWQQLGLYNIESIEVHRGGQSVLYGNHALSGVVDIKTRKGGDPGAQLKATAGSFGFEEYSASGSASIGNVYCGAGVMIQRDDGFRENSESWAKNINGYIGGYLNENQTLTFRASGGESYYKLPNLLIYSEIKNNPTHSYSDGNEDGKTDNGRFSAIWEGKTDWGGFFVNGGFNWRSYDIQMSAMSSESDHRGASLTPRIEFGTESNSIIAGVDLRYDELDHEGATGDTVVRNKFTSHAELYRITAGPYIMAKKTWMDLFTFGAGARYEVAYTKGKNLKHKMPDGDPYIPNPWAHIPGAPPFIPNPNYSPDPELVEGESFDDSVVKHGLAAELSLTWRVTDSFSVWGRYNTVYRYPVLDEMMSFQGYPMMPPFNSDLDPETGNNFELGVKCRKDNWEASATFFYLMMDDEIAYTQTYNADAGRWDFQNANIGETERLGADLMFRYEKENYGVMCMTELVRARFIDGEYNGKEVPRGKKIPLVPEIHGFVSLWAEPHPKVRLSGIYQWFTKQYAGGDFDNENIKSSIWQYDLVGLRADIKVTKNLKLFFKVDNLFDKIYASSAYLGGYYPGTGRAFYGGASLEF